ncbi:MAG TPA: nuclear transport factor 2 family protein [Capillimicrobium sp.]|nr:nuclear transport factor 2 family protein [Capillimicrobium sp.]
MRSRFDGIPDVRYEDDRHWVCGDRGVSEWTIRGTRRTGERIEVRGCDLFELADGRIRRKDSFWKILD